MPDAQFGRRQNAHWFHIYCTPRRLFLSFFFYIAYRRVAQRVLVRRLLTVRVVFLRERELQITLHLKFRFSRFFVLRKLQFFLFQFPMNRDLAEREKYNESAGSPTIRDRFGFLLFGALMFSLLIDPFLIS